MCLVNNGGKMSAEYGYTTGHTYAQLDDVSIETHTHEHIINLIM